MHIVFRVELSSVLCVVCDYSLMSEVTRAYPLLVWRVTLGLPTVFHEGCVYWPAKAGVQQLCCCGCTSGTPGKIVYFTVW